jgi:hypothetical protein
MSLSEVQRVRIYERVLERLARIPGVQSAAFSSERLFGGGTWTEPVNAPAFRPLRGQDREAVLLVISPRFFETMGTTAFEDVRSRRETMNGQRESQSSTRQRLVITSAGPTL